jgi:hypothetical protein
MIISASRRTDIPAFYTPWFINRVREGFVRLANPYFPSQVREISLLPRDVDLFVFWSKNPAPLLPYLPGLEKAGYPYYVHFTLTGYPSPCEAAVPPLAAGLTAFRTLSRLCGPGRVIWRYDPVILAHRLDLEYHIRRFSEIVEALRGTARRVYISFFDFYKNAVKRMKAYPGLNPREIRENPGELDRLLKEISGIAGENGFQVYSCAETMDLSRYDILHGKCIDDLLIEEEFGLCFSHAKDPGQRKACKCIKSVDIGSYNTCVHGCVYCYAVHDVDKAKKSYRDHDTTSPFLVPGVVP